MCNALYAGQQQRVMIFDARPQINARANMFKGGGYETCDSKNYANCQIKFCRIPNIHEVRTCTRKLFQLAYSDSQDSSKVWQQSVDATGYRQVLQLILDATNDILNSIAQEPDQNILIHCSDGWDRTSQLCALS